MIIPILALVFGAIVGAVRASRREGTRRDMAQWATVHALIFGVAGVFVLVIIERVVA